MSIIALTLWAASFALVTVLVAGQHIVADVWMVYSAAGRHWWAHAPLYNPRTVDDFQYFPQAAMLFGVLAPLGTPLGSIVWRALGWGLFAHAMWRLSSVASPQQRQKFFLVATAIVILPAFTSLVNGQANLHVAALMMQATVDLAGQRRRRVMLWFTLGLAIKPIMAVMVLLSCVQYPAILWTTAAAAGLVLVVPLATAPTAYVISQYHACASKLAVSAQPHRLFEDLRGLSSTLGWLIPDSLLRVLRVLAAFGAVGLCLRLRRRWKEPAAAIFLLAIAAAYLMLFNTRTQANSYVIVAPAATLAATNLLLKGRTRAAVVMLAIIACWCGSATVWTALWLKPLACVVFCVLLIRQIRRRPPSEV